MYVSVSGIGKHKYTLALKRDVFHNNYVLIILYSLGNSLWTSSHVHRNFPQPFLMILSQLDKLLLYSFSLLTKDNDNVIHLTENMVQTKRTEGDLVSLRTHLETIADNWGISYALYPKRGWFEPLSPTLNEYLIPCHRHELTFAPVLNRHTKKEQRLQKGHPLEILLDHNNETSRGLSGNQEQYQRNRYWWEGGHSSFRSKC